jgi:DNA-binding CsgD family transcriptional regulator
VRARRNRVLEDLALVVDVVGRVAGMNQRPEWWVDVRKHILERHNVPSIEAAYELVDVRPVRLNATKAELPVLIALTQGLTVKQIAAHLGMSQNTVKTHLQRFYRRNEAANGAQAAAIVARALVYEEVGDLICTLRDGYWWGNPHAKNALNHVLDRLNLMERP